MLFIFRLNRPYLDQCLGAFEEMLPALRLGTFLVPINDCLIRDTIFVVQNLTRTKSVPVMRGLMKDRAP